MLNPERRIKGRDDAALCTGLAVKLDWFVTDTLIDEALRLQTRQGGGLNGKRKDKRNKLHSTPYARELHHGNPTHIA